MKLNNKKRQSAVYSTIAKNVFAKLLRGQHIRNGYFKQYYDPLFVPIPKALQEETAERWKVFRRNVISSMPITINIKVDKGYIYEK